MVRLLCRSIRPAAYRAWDTPFAVHSDLSNLLKSNEAAPLSGGCRSQTPTPRRYEGAGGSTLSSDRPWTATLSTDHCFLSRRASAGDYELAKNLVTYYPRPAL